MRLLPLLDPLEYLVKLLHRLIRLGYAAQKVVHYGRIRLLLAVLDLLKYFQDHLERPVFLTGIHQQLEDFQGELGILNGCDAADDLYELLETETFLQLVLVTQGRDPH